MKLDTTDITDMRRLQFAKSVKSFNNESKEVSIDKSEKTTCFVNLSLKFYTEKDFKNLLDKYNILLKRKKEYGRYYITNDKEDYFTKIYSKKDIDFTIEVLKDLNELNLKIIELTDLYYNNNDKLEAFRIFYHTLFYKNRLYSKAESIYNFFEEVIL